MRTMFIIPAIAVLVTIFMAACCSRANAQSLNTNIKSVNSSICIK